MESHKRVISILYIVMGSLQALFLLFMAAFISSILPWIVDREHFNHSDATILHLVSIFLPALFVGLIILIALPSIIGGIALLNGKKWALTLLLVVGCFKLFSFPIGTALGIYTIWVYAEDNKQSSQTNTNAAT